MINRRRLKTAKTPEINSLFVFPLMSNYVEDNLFYWKKRKIYENFASTNKKKLFQQVEGKESDRKLIFYGGLFSDAFSPRVPFLLPSFL